MEKYVLACEEQALRWSKGESLAPCVDFPRPGSLEEAKEQCVLRHNELRARHGSGPLQWSDDLAKSAKAAAQHCVEISGLTHSNTSSKEPGGTRKNVDNGQNATLAGSDTSFADATDGWYAEIDNFNFDLLKAMRDVSTMLPQHRGVVGHFTQVVSSRSTHVGMAKVGDYIFANYWPPGNVGVPNFDPITPEGKAAALAEGVGAPGKPKVAPAPKDIYAEVKEDPVQVTINRINGQHNRGAVNKIRALFLSSDRNRDGFLQADELEAIMEKLGMKRAETKKLMEAADANKDGQLDIEEFLLWIFSGKKKAEIALKKA